MILGCAWRLSVPCLLVPGEPVPGVDGSEFCGVALNSPPWIDVSRGEGVTHPQAIRVMREATLEEYLAQQGIMVPHESAHYFYEVETD